jgi:GT2 family glycosyltransferase
MIGNPRQDVAIVAIGRNEAERLKSCLRSAVSRARMVVYVDSGSLDGSPQFARSMSCHVVELDPARPFSAARARNEGFSCVLEHDPQIPFVQFLDGDCDLTEGWLEEASSALREHEDVGVVCGRLRERHPDATIYNKLYSLEWHQGAGEVRATGGNFMVRREVFQATGGFRADVIAAEDNEFCVRVRLLGFRILQLNAEMAGHDVAMTRFGQWWVRSRRTGHAYAQVAGLHGGSQERYFVSDCRKIWLWGFWLPLLALLLAFPSRGISLLLLALAYALQFVRIYRTGTKRGWPARDASLYSFFTVLFKFPALCGLLEYHWRRWRGQGFAIIEYKGVHNQ